MLLRSLSGLCLCALGLAQIQQPFQADERRLISFFSEPDSHQWATLHEKIALKAQGIGFFDITNTQIRRSPKKQYEYPREPKAAHIVEGIIANLSTAGPKENLDTFTSFHTRAFFLEHGKNSSEWLANRIREYSAQYRRNITVSLIQHKDFPQNSVVARLAPPNATELDPITIIAAHCDSLNYANITGRAPGADDDGSGSVSILEALRGILASTYTPTSPIEFHFYAAEEAGLLGSLDIAESYETAGKNIRAMQQMDTVAWVKEGSEEHIGVFRQYTNSELTKFQKVLIDKYLSIPWKETDYPGSAGSDHFSWFFAGYQTAHVTESRWENMNVRNVHTPNDTSTSSPEFSFDHMLEFSKLAVAFAVELSNY